MKRFISIIVLIVSGCLISFTSFAQEEPDEAESTTSDKEEIFLPHHQLGLAIGHAHVFEGIDEHGKKEMLSMPSWSLDYTYVFHPKWGVGLHTDFIMEKFKVEKSEGEIVERSYPVAPALMGIYKPSERWNLMLGMGGEFAKEESYVLTRAAVEYGVAIRNGWEVSGSVSYDFRWSAYDTWNIGIGITKSFHFSKHHTTRTNQH